MAFSMDSTIGDVLKDPNARSVLDKYAPGVLNNPLVSMAEVMSFKQVLSFPEAQQAGLTQDRVQAFLNEVNRLDQGQAKGT